MEDFWWSRHGPPATNLTCVHKVMIKPAIKRLSDRVSDILRSAYKGNKPIPALPESEIHNPIEHNTKERLDELYSNPEVVTRYIDNQRIAFYKNIIEICCQKGIQFRQKNVADIGCGTGHLLKFIEEQSQAASLTGFEYSASAITVAKTICPEAFFQEYDLYQNPDHSFDVIFCIEVLEHLLYPEKALQNCLKMLVHNGVLIMTVPDGRKDTFLGHINFWSPESWNIFIESQCKELKYETGQMDNEANYAFVWKE